MSEGVSEGGSNGGRWGRRRKDPTMRGKEGGRKMDIK